ncbi:MAG: DNA polymerase subunit beta [Desulfobacterales bacterium CG23_combo_of_CG06-09_8_20_14_all_51_8]|nr:MAG: DNA polymerase subunit beta [Desulfobacterales bacterium CG23_combo_of_CG06-09_8_20_14_all_51_8]
MDSKEMMVARELRSKISCKYVIRDFKLFGSSARGDRRIDSDIDIFIRLPRLDSAIEEDLFDMAYDLELAHDCVIDVIAVGDAEAGKNLDALPIYQNILSEGVVL